MSSVGVGSADKITDATNPIGLVRSGQRELYSVPVTGLLGRYQVNTTISSAGSTTTVVNLGTTTQIKVGDILRFSDASVLVIAYAEVRAVNSATQVTLGQALPFAPPSGWTVYIYRETPLLTDQTGNQNVNIINSPSVTTTSGSYTNILTNGLSQSSNSFGTDTAFVDVIEESIYNFSGVSLELADSTFSGWSGLCQLDFLASMDYNTYVPISLYSDPQLTNTVTGTNSPGRFYFPNVCRYNSFRVTISSTSTSGGICDYYLLRTPIGTSYTAISDGGNSITVDGSVSVSGIIYNGLSATATRTDVAGSASSVTLIASNGARRRVTIFNDSTAILYVLEGTGTASTTNFTYKLQQDNSVTIDDYYGDIKGIWASATGNARITEIT